MYFQAWLTLREGDKAKNEGKFLEAFNRYDKAKKLFDSVALYHPDFKADLVKTRQESTAEAMGLIKDRALAEHQKLTRRSNDLAESPNAPTLRKDFVIPTLSKEDQRKIKALQQQIGQYNSELQVARSDRDANAVRLRKALKELEGQRDRMARAPVAGQLQDLNSRISKVERERDAMAGTLRESRREHQQIQIKLGTAEADSAAAQERAAELQKLVEVQQSASKQVVEGLRRQLKELRATVGEKDKQLSELQAHNAELDKQLQEAHSEILDLRDERDALLAERDQMAALLKLNESERVRLLIKQNMELGRNLKTASDRLIEVHSDNNATQDDLIEAKRDIAHAKGRLIDFQRENASQKNRLSKLEERLRHAGNDLETGLKNTAVDPKGREEMEMLRGIISRQLRVQEHRKLSKEAVMTEVRRMAKEDNILIPQLNGLFEQELRLTAEESELIKEFKIDEDFIFSDRPNRREFVNAGQELQQSISIKDKVARRAYANERFLAAREVFESILAEHPGHVETILNLGVVHVKNNEIPLAIDSFNNAIVIRGENLPFAQFMLGVCHYRLGEFQESNTYLRKSLELENDNAQAYIFLGSVAGREMKHEEAEVHFKTAISIDPTLAQPYYNLAVIYLDKGDKQEALKYYREALKRGADPNLKFEASLAMRN
ncbi:MAG: tetratricopeptide repeat protein [Roseibacillus sp.]|nr:tetratricopeptide repeat protein [Roseibacillus sp.]